MVRLRIKYEKVGAIRFSSHRDTMRIFRRSLAAGRVPVSFSQGYNPHPRLSFGPSLRTGWESLGEYMDIILDRAVPAIDAMCNPFLPDGLRIVGAATLDSTVPKLSGDIDAVRYRIVLAAVNFESGDSSRFFEERGAPRVGDGGAQPPHARLLQEAICERLSNQPHEETARPEAPALLDIQVYTKDGDICVDYQSEMRDGKSLFPEQILSPLTVERDPLEMPSPPRVVRIDQYVRRGGTLVPPTDVAVVRNRKKRSLSI